MKKDIKKYFQNTGIKLIDVKSVVLNINLSKRIIKHSHVFLLKMKFL